LDGRHRADPDFTGYPLSDPERLNVVGNPAAESTHSWRSISPMVGERLLNRRHSAGCSKFRVARRAGFWQQGRSGTKVWRTGAMQGRRKPETVIAMLALALTLAAPSGVARAAGQAGEAQAPPVRTGKERLSGKSADEQRVDNCKVPVALRGSKPRPADCEHRGRSAPTQ
jgi:hypothetical protein